MSLGSTTTVSATATTTVPVASSLSGRTTLGVACGAGAGALWGLVFLAPALASDFSPLQLTVGRYLFYGLIAAALLAGRWRALFARIGRAQWLALGWLAFTGNTLYYVLLSGAVQLGGVAMTSLVIGFLPVIITLVGSREHGAVPLQRLLPSLLLCAVGALSIGWQALAAMAGQEGMRSVLGLLCAVGALISWSAFAVGNARSLKRLHKVSAHEWNLLTGLVTGVQSLVLLPLALMGSAQHGAADWALLAAVSAGVAVLASVLGNTLWNRMSRLLPLTLAGQMILFETLFALSYGLMWEQRLPTALEMLALGCVVLGVISCLHAHSARRA